MIFINTCDCACSYNQNMSNKILDE